MRYREETWLDYQERSQAIGGQDAQPAEASPTRRLPYLALCVLLLALSFFVFTKADLHSSDLFDTASYEDNLLKLSSPAFILFVFSFALAIACAIKFGFKAKKITSTTPLVCSLALTAAAAPFAPKFLPPFAGFAIATGAASIASSYAKEMDGKAAWSTAKKALTVLVIAAFILTFLKVSYAREEYADIFLASISEMAKETSASMAPLAVKQYLSVCAQSIEKAQVSPESLMLSEGEMRGIVQATQPSLSQETQDVVVSSCASIEKSQAALAANKLKFALANSVRQTNVTQAVSQSNVESAASPETLRQQFNAIPQARQIISSLPLIAAFAVVSLLSFINFFLAAIAAGGVLFLNRIGLD